MVKQSRASSEPQETQEQYVTQIFSVIEKAIQKCPKYAPKDNYILEVRKANILNLTLRTQLGSLQAQIESIQNQVKEMKTQTSTLVKKNRRKAEQIEKKYKCQVEQCDKAYGSEASLNLHQKLKHSPVYSECETLSVKLEVPTVDVC